MAGQTIPNDTDPKNPLIIVTLPNIIKLTSTNFLSWKLQIEATLVGYGLFKFLDGSHPSPSPTIAQENSTAPNPSYLTWIRQDRLLYGTLIGTLEPTIVPLVSLTTTSKALWDTLASTFASSSRGHIKQLRSKFKSLTKGPQSVTEFMQSVKMCTDQLALLGDPIKPEDITDKVLESLDSSYSGVIDAINARDDPISFAELHEKLINRELVIRSQPIIGSLPASVHATYTRSFPSSQPRHNNNNNQHANSNRHTHYTHSTNHSNTSRPFLGKCQWCHTKGHSLQKCPVFNAKHPTITPPPPPTFSTNAPQANVATASAVSTSSPWPLDSGASHHVTQDLNNLSFHKPYDGTEEIVIGDGSGLPITHTGSAYGGTPPNGSN